MSNLTDQELKALAKSECVKQHGAEDWNTMFSGDQEAYIETWIDGYRFAKSEKQLPSGMPEVSEAEVALLNILANIGDDYRGDGGDQCPLCDCDETWMFSSARRKAFEAALPDLIKRKSHG